MLKSSNNVLKNVTNEVNEIINVNNTPIEVNDHPPSPIDEPIEYDRLRGRYRQDDAASEAAAAGLQRAYYNSHSRFHMTKTSLGPHNPCIIDFELSLTGPTLCYLPKLINTQGLINTAFWRPFINMCY